MYSGYSLLLSWLDDNDESFDTSRETNVNHDHAWRATHHDCEEIPEKGKLFERAGRKAKGLKLKGHDSLAARVFRTPI